MGVGLVREVDEHVEYRYATKSPPHRSVIWERNVEHSIRPGFADGFLFPYRELFDLALEKGVDPEQFLAFAPDEAFWSFSYGSEHVSHDDAIASVLSCLRALERIQEVIPGPWAQASAWLDRQLNRLWRMRGPFPGFGSALTAFLGDRGNLIAYEIAGQCTRGGVDGNVDPWPAFERIVEAPGTASGIAGDSHWRRLRPRLARDDRRAPGAAEAPEPLLPERRSGETVLQSRPQATRYRRIVSHREPVPTL